MSLITSALARIDKKTTEERVDANEARLYISDLISASSPKHLEAAGITHIVSATLNKHINRFGAREILHVLVDDKDNVPIHEHFPRVVHFIQHALDADEKNKVLVHCYKGRSRSATLVCAYLIATTPMRANHAIAFLKTKRGEINPIRGFRKQLLDWEVEFESAIVEAERKNEIMSPEEVKTQVANFRIPQRYETYALIIRWIRRRRRSRMTAKTQATHVQIPEGVDTKPDSVSSEGGGDHK